MPLRHITRPSMSCFFFSTNFNNLLLECILSNSGIVIGVSLLILTSGRHVFAILGEVPHLTFLLSFKYGDTSTQFSPVNHLCTPLFVSGLAPE